VFFHKHVPQDHLIDTEPPCRRLDGELLCDASKLVEDRRIIEAIDGPGNEALQRTGMLSGFKIAAPELATDAEDVGLA
jgi:hypothetical protein